MVGGGGGGGGGGGWPLKKEQVEFVHLVFCSLVRATLDVSECIANE